MDRKQRKILRERNERIRKALAQKPHVPGKGHGLSPLQIRNIIEGKDKLGNANVHGSGKRRTKSRKFRPRQAQRTLINANLKLLLDVPIQAINNAVEWPTPSWFRNDENVDVSVIVPLYKSHEVVEGLINSWDLDNSGLRVEMVFVDDHSPSDCKRAVVDYWKKRQGELRTKVGRIYHNQTNLGFGGACNAGVWKARGEYVIIINADTLVTKDWIRPMIRLMERNQDIGIVGNLQIKKNGMWDGTIDGAGSEWDWESGTFMHIGRHIYKGRKIGKPMSPNNCPNELHSASEREMVTGCCMAFRRKDFMEMGGFDPNYRIGYWEDSDLCMRFREKGYKIYYQPASQIYHLLGHSGSGSHKYQSHNQNCFFNKWVNSGRIDKLVKAVRPKRKTPLENILVRRQSAYGDVLVATAILPALKVKYPDAHLLFNTRCPEVLKENPFITKILTNEQVSERLFQVLINLDMTYEARPFTNILEAYADAAGVDVADCQTFMATQKVENLPQKYVVVHAGQTMWAGRNWTPHKFEAIAQRIAGHGYKVVCVGRKGDNKVTSHLDLRGNTTFAQLGYVIQNARLFVGIDSCPMHIAQTFNVPGVAFFGCIDPLTRLYNDSIVPITAKGLECIGCHHRKMPPVTSTNFCENGSLDCVGKVTIDNFWNKIEELL